MIRVDAATVLLQWATGGLFFTWFTTRRRLVGIGYGWLMRGTFALMALGAFVCGLSFGVHIVREAAAVGVAAAAVAAFAVSFVRRRAGVRGQADEHDRRTARVAAMTGIERDAPTADPTTGPEFPPVLDLIAPLIGVIGLVAAGAAAGGNDAVAIVRTLVGAAFLGAITDAMLLGHWYLVQPGLPRGLLNELVNVTKYALPVEVAALLLPTGMVSVLDGHVKDGWGGTLGYFWIACALTTGGLCIITQRALREKYYSAVMAATGLLYLAILTAFGTDLVARIVLAG
ncbi:MAG TPA: hypothetical protein VGM78_05760 [Ilumatobacteraceae bacterium]